MNVIEKPEANTMWLHDMRIIKKIKLEKFCDKREKKIRRKSNKSVKAPLRKKVWAKDNKNSQGTCAVQFEKVLKMDKKNSSN